MARRSSGWTVAKQIVREIDRANKRSQRESASREKAFIREQERTIKAQERAIIDEQKLRDKLTKQQNKFNAALQAANSTTNISTKEKKLDDARHLLKELRDLERYNSSVHLGDLSEVQKSIQGVQNELDALIAQEEEKQSLEVQAVKNTEKAQKLRADIDNVLIHTLSVNDAIDWEELKDTQEFLIREPSKPPKPMLPSRPDTIVTPPEPQKENFKPKIPLHLHLMKSKKSKMLDEAEQSYQQSLEMWKELKEKNAKDNEKNTDKWIKNKDKVLVEWEGGYKKSCKDWEKRKKDHEEAQSKYNSEIETLKAQYEASEKDAIEEYCRLVLSRSEYTADLC